MLILHYTPSPCYYFHIMLYLIPLNQPQLYGDIIALPPHTCIHFHPPLHPSPCSYVLLLIYLTLLHQYQWSEEENSLPLRHCIIFILQCIPNFFLLSLSYIILFFDINPNGLGQHLTFFPTNASFFILILNIFCNCPYLQLCHWPTLSVGL